MTTTAAGGKLKPWHCDECDKFLSSKRSFREHMNVHKKARPFQCDNCDYAAASQMTLRRHTLRSHTPRREWGYPCPYCSEIYMEPASYQQHVSHRHFGQSCTFGCPHKSCNFTSKCTKSFIEHVSKHLIIVPENPEIVGDDFKDNYDPASLNPLKYLIDDEIGSGFGKPPQKAHIQRCHDVLSLTKQKPAPLRPHQSVTIPVNKMRAAEKKNCSLKLKEERPRIQKQVEILPTTTTEESTCWQTEIGLASDGFCEIASVDFKQEEGDEEDETQYFEFVDEKGETVDGHFYYYEYDVNGTQYLERVDNNSWEFEEVAEDEHEELVEGIKEEQIVNFKQEERRLPDGQLDIDLD